MRTAFWLVAATLTLGGAGAGPSAEPEPPASAVTRLGAAWLVRDAWQTHARQVRATRTSEGEVPPELWGDALKELKPLRVYFHRVNVVAVLRSDGRTEEGLYVSLPISSFIPTQGTDGFAYTPVAREVSAYRRNLAAAGKLGK